MNDPTNGVSLSPHAWGPTQESAAVPPEVGGIRGGRKNARKPAAKSGHAGRGAEGRVPLEIVRRDDRASIARFVLSNGPLIRMRLRDRLGSDVRRVFDTDDLIATVARRMDGLAESGNLRAESSAQMWALMVSIAEHAASEHRRRARTERKLGKARIGEALSSQADAAVQDSRADDIGQARRIESALGLDQADYVTLRVRLAGGSNAQVGAALGASTAAVRMRCIRLRARVVDHMPEGRHDRAENEVA